MSDRLLMTSESTAQYLPLYSHSRVILPMELSLCPPNVMSLDSELCVVGSVGGRFLILHCTEHRCRS